MSVPEHDFKLVVFDSKLLVVSLVLLIDDELTLVVLVLTNVEDFPGCEGLQTVVFDRLTQGMRGDTHV